MGMERVIGPGRTCSRVARPLVASRKGAAGKAWHYARGQFQYHPYMHRERARTVAHAWGDVEVVGAPTCVCWWRVCNFIVAGMA